MDRLNAPYPVLGREAAVYVSTSFNEIVTCVLPDGETRRLLLKRGGVPADDCLGHRGGVPYESEIYRHVLEPMAISVPRFHATFLDAAETSLWIDFVEDAARLHQAGRSFMVPAATWIGEFHRRNETRINNFPTLLNHYDLSYFLGWPDRTLALVGSLGSSWLQKVCDAFTDLAKSLVAPPLTIIHGEYYPKNVLVRGKADIVPVDWESAAVGAGEIDLASLTSGWPDEIQDACISAYHGTRWPDHHPPDFERRMVAARMYFMFRWLGDPDRCDHPERQLDELRKFATTAGIL